MRLSLGPIVLFLGVSLASAAAPPPMRTDLYGDPLPEGAIARLGSVRLRHSGLNDFVCLPGSKTILTAGRDGVLRYWDVKSGKPLRTIKLQGNPGAGYGHTLSPDGKTLVAHEPGKLLFWEVESGKQLKPLPAPKLGGTYLYFSPDGKYLVIGRTDARVSLWDWKAGKERELPLPFLAGRDGTHDSSAHSVFSPDSKLLVAGANSSQPLGVFDVETGRELHRLTCHAMTSTISPDNKTLAVSSRLNDKGGADTVIRFFDLTSGKPIKQFALGHLHSYFWLTFSPDGKSLACGSSERGCLLDCATGKVLHQLAGPRCIMMGFTPDGKTLMGNSKRLHLWDVATGKALHDYPGDFGWLLATAISPDGRRLATADFVDSEVNLWELSTGRLIRQIPLTSRDQRYIRGLAFSSDGRTLFAGYALGGRIQSWETETGKELGITQLQSEAGTHPQQLHQIHLLPNAKQIVALQMVSGQGGAAMRLGKWELGTGKLLRHQMFHPKTREDAWYADSKAVALLTPDGLTLWDLERNAPRFRTIENVSGPVAGSPSSRLLAAFRQPGGVAVWETATGKEVATVPAEAVTFLGLAPDQRSLITSDKQHVCVWDLATGKQRQRWELPASVMPKTHAVNHLRLSPDGRRLFTALADGSGLVWDLSAVLKPSAPLAKSPDKKELEAWWADLANADAARAYAAVWRLSEQPEATVLGLVKRLRPLAEADAAQISKLIEALDSDDFETREKATKQLEKLGRATIAGLREALQKKPSLEVARRVEKLLTRAQNEPLTADELRRLRAIVVLERLESKEARRLCDELR